MNNSWPHSPFVSCTNQWHIKLISEETLSERSYCHQKHEKKTNCFDFSCVQRHLYFWIFFEWTPKNEKHFQTRIHLPPASIDFLVGMFATLRVVYYGVNVTIQKRNGWKTDVWHNECRVYLCICIFVDNTNIHKKGNPFVYVLDLERVQKSSIRQSQRLLCWYAEIHHSIKFKHGVESFTHNHTAYLSFTHSQTHTYASK